MDDGAAHLLVDADHRAHRQIMATDVFGGIQPPQTELMRAPIHLVALGGGERNPFARGLAFLVGAQNADGSFGSAGRTKDLNIMAGVGSHFGFRAATTALAVQALIEEDDGTPGVAAAIDRGERWLFERLPDVRRDDPTMIYNVWAHAYGIQALVAMHGRKPDDVARRERIVELIHGQFARLVKYESAQGGWGYYDFNVGSQRPASSSTSFVNAAVLIAFDDARRIGIEPPEKVTQRAILATEEQMLPDFS